MLLTTKGIRKDKLGSGLVDSMEDPILSLYDNYFQIPYIDVIWDRTAHEK